MNLGFGIIFCAENHFYYFFAALELHILYEIV